jgi:putative transposase
MDEAHLIAAVRYVAMNPVRARLVAYPRDWPWSSARAHLTGENDGLVAIKPLLERIDDFASFLAAGEDPSATGALRAAETTGRPLGNEAFIEGLERLLGRKLARGRPGPAPKSVTIAEQPDLWG